MTQDANKLARTGLQWSIGLVLIYECSRLLFSAGAAHSFEKTHLPQWLRLAIGSVELLGAILFLIPPTVRGWRAPSARNFRSRRHHPHPARPSRRGISGHLRDGSADGNDRSRSPLKRSRARLYPAFVPPWSIT